MDAFFAAVHMLDNPKLVSEMCIVNCCADCPVQILHKTDGMYVDPGDSVTARPRVVSMRCPIACSMTPFALGNVACFLVSELLLRKTMWVCPESFTARRSHGCGRHGHDFHRQLQGTGVRCPQRHARYALVRIVHESSPHMHHQACPEWYNWLGLNCKLQHIYTLHALHPHACIYHRYTWIVMPHLQGSSGRRCARSLCSARLISRGG